jgi:hypothetical protein
MVAFESSTIQHSTIQPYKTMSNEDFNLLVAIVSLIAGLLSIFFSLRKLYREYWASPQTPEGGF